MKLFKFFTCDHKGNILGPSTGHFDVLRKFPSEFTEDHIKAEPFFSQSIKNRACKMRKGSMIRITKLCGWSSRSGDAEYLFIKCLGDDSTNDLDNVNELRKKISGVQEEIEKINTELEKLAGPVLEKLDKLSKDLRKLKETEKQFHSTGVL